MEENVIVLDVSGAADKKGLHQILKETFAFPDYYGGNWDALNDCLTECLEPGEKYRIVLKGTRSMTGEMGKHLAAMNRVFLSVREEMGNLTIQTAEDDEESGGARGRPGKRIIRL